ncbi:calcium/sodium antiporter [Permianibacter aggregans]|uniref:Cation:H+ antiporter n=1 Tax=Permianibacter aggregans TaxID=1510150 RepID=A0A4R6USB6_9GAMM|nr:calcium/sodium antiporter [Permianibacter aggregans]QGX40042.1 calcium/sodium antiporter [Permianibacter aggregans]TDQ49146.1 cation:H+ antiporter [Permianibacter aggregans]
MFEFALAIVLGLALLVWSADKFIEGASATARHLGLSLLFIGMVVIGFGTSAPEMIVSAMAAAEGASDLALGNAYGSNIVNLTLILGATALTMPIRVESPQISKEIPLLIAATVISFLLLLDRQLQRFDALILLSIFVVYLAWAYRSARVIRGDDLAREMAVEIPELRLSFALLWLVLGLVLLLASSRLLVWGAIGLAEHFGVSDLLIGLTIVAVGTALPELASSITAARKHEHDIALGNIIGSNIFNTLSVVGIAGSIHPDTIPEALLWRDFPVMLTLTVGLILVIRRYRQRQLISRIDGSVLLLFFFSYTIFLFVSQ